MQPDSAHNQVRNELKSDSIGQKSSRIRSGIPECGRILLRIRSGQLESNQNYFYQPETIQNEFQDTQNGQVLIRIESGQPESVQNDLDQLETVQNQVWDTPTLAGFGQN